LTLFSNPLLEDTLLSSDVIRLAASFGAPDRELMARTVLGCYRANFVARRDGPHAAAGASRVDRHLRLHVSQCLCIVGMGVSDLQSHNPRSVEVEKASHELRETQ